MSQAAQQMKHKVIKEGGGRIMGVDSGTIMEMQAAGVDTAKLATEAAPLEGAASSTPAGAALAAAAAGTDDTAARPGVSSTSESAAQPLSSAGPSPRLPPGVKSHHYPRQSLMSMRAERRPGGGIVTVDAPTSVSG